MAQSAKDIRIMEQKDTIAQLNKTIKSLTLTVESLQKTVESLNQSLSNKQAELDYCKSKLFGSSSEKTKTPIPGQISLFEDLQDDREPELIQPEEIIVGAHKRTRKKKATYDEMFKNLPRREVRVDTLSSDEKICPVCKSEMTAIGTELIRTELVFHPAVLERVDYVGTTYECQKCKDTLEPQFLKDKGTAPLIPHSYASEELVAHTMYSKFVNAMPFYRQEKDFYNQFGVNISRTSMANLTIFCEEEYFKPLLKHFEKELVKRRFLAADETPIQVLNEEGRRAQSKSYIWLFRSGDDELAPIIIYKYHPTRNGDAVAEFFKDADDGAYIMVDGYAGYNKLKGFNRCCCYAHIRRYFKEAISQGKAADYTDPALQGFLYCNKLFEYERRYNEKGLSFKQKQNRRMKDEKPLVEAFLSWLKTQDAPKGSRLDRALTYARNQRQYMMTFLEDSHCSICNNLSENSIRPVTVGRRNWLFSDSVQGAEASMMLYSLLETARANELNPKKYLEYVLKARPSEKMTSEELELLTPWNKEVQKVCTNISE